MFVLMMMTRGCGFISIHFTFVPPSAFPTDEYVLGELCQRYTHFYIIGGRRVEVASSFTNNSYACQSTSRHMEVTATHEVVMNAEKITFKRRDIYLDVEMKSMIHLFMI